MYADACKTLCDAHVPCAAGVVWQLLERARAVCGWCSVAAVGARTCRVRLVWRGSCWNAHVPFAAGVAWQIRCCDSMVVRCSYDCKFI